MFNPVEAIEISVSRTFKLTEIASKDISKRNLRLRVKLTCLKRTWKIIT